MRKSIQAVVFVLLVLLLCSCSGKETTSFVREDVPLGFVKKVCVLPLENNTKEQYAAELARDVINTRILARNLFDIVDKGIADSVLYEEAIDPGSPLSLVKIKRLGQRLDVQALLVGSVDLAGDKRIGSHSVPEMSLTLRLIEIKSGVILWQASGHHDGDSLAGRLLGTMSSDMYMVTSTLVDRMLSSVPASAEGMMPVQIAE